MRQRTVRDEGGEQGPRPDQDQGRGEDRGQDYGPGRGQEEHLVSTVERGAFSHARCSCGWAGPARRSRETSRADAAAHNESQGGSTTGHESGDGGEDRALNDG